LAKLCQINGSILSTAEARGTIGFIAPEEFSRAFETVMTLPYFKWAQAHQTPFWAKHT